MPSKFLITVLTSAEKHYRRITLVNNTLDNITLLRLQRNVVADIGRALEIDDHSLESQVGIENHKFSLIRSIVAVCCNLRQHHRTKLHNMKLHTNSVRHTLTKTILFRGQ